MSRAHDLKTLIKGRQEKRGRSQNDQSEDDLFRKRKHGASSLAVI
jgi:hypothetical protein